MFCRAERAGERNTLEELLWPFLSGATIGVLVGVTILGWMQALIGVLLVLYSFGCLALPANVSSPLNLNMVNQVAT
jgi:hypothetical protein